MAGSPPAILAQVHRIRFEEAREMKIGWFAGIDSPTLDELVARAKRASASGFDTFWLPQVTGFDALVALAVVAREIGRAHV